MVEGKAARVIADLALGRAHGREEKLRKGQVDGRRDACERVGAEDFGPNRRGVGAGRGAREIGLYADHAQFDK